MFRIVNNIFEIMVVFFVVAWHTVEDITLPY